MNPLFRYGMLVGAALGAGTATAQQPAAARQAVYAEAGGNGLLYSLNYERRLLHPAVAVRVGISWLRVQERGRPARQTLLTMPVTVSYLWPLGGSAHHLEAGAGLCVVYSAGNLVEYRRRTDVFPNLTGIVGYRYQPSSGGLVLKAGFTPQLGFKTLTGNGEQAFTVLGRRLLPWGGVGIGYSF